MGATQSCVARSRSTWVGMFGLHRTRPSFQSHAFFPTRVPPGRAGGQGGRITFSAEGALLGVLWLCHSTSPEGGGMAARTPKGFAQVSFIAGILLRLLGSNRCIVGVGSARRTPRSIGPQTKQPGVRHPEVTPTMRGRLRSGKAMRIAGRDETHRQPLRWCPQSDDSLTGEGHPVAPKALARLN